MTTIPFYTQQQNTLLNWLLELNTTNKYLPSLQNQANGWLEADEPLYPAPLTNKQLTALQNTYNTIYKPRLTNQTNKNKATLIGGPLHQKTIELPQDTQAITITTSKTITNYTADTIAGIRIFLHQSLTNQNNQEDTINQELMEHETTNY